MQQFYSSVENYIPLAVKMTVNTFLIAIKDFLACLEIMSGVFSHFKCLLWFTMPTNPTKLSFKSGLKELSCINVNLHAVVCRFIMAPHTTTRMAGNDDISIFLVCVLSHKQFKFSRIHPTLDLTFCPSACYKSKSNLITGIQKNNSLCQSFSL